MRIVAAKALFMTVWWANLLSATHRSTHHSHWVLFDSRLENCAEIKYPVIKYLRGFLWTIRQHLIYNTPSSWALSAKTKCPSAAKLSCRFPIKCRTGRVMTNTYWKMTTLYQKLCFKTVRHGGSPYIGIGQPMAAGDHVVKQDQRSRKCVIADVYFPWERKT